MNERDITDSSIDRSKRPRLEEEMGNGNNIYNGKEDRHPKRQAVPDPETRAPHFTGDDKKDTQRRNYKSTNDDDNANVDLDYSGDSLPPTLSSNMGSSDTLNLKKRHVNISLRSLVNSKDAGVIIGRGGKNVNDIRQHSSARVNISDMVYGAYDRVLTVNGSVESVAKAYSMVSDKIMPEKDQDHLPKTTSSIRLLVPDIRIGSLIGRSGNIIKSTQEESGAYMHISEEILAMSTERILTITGTPKSIYIAVARVGDILADLSQRPHPALIPPSNYYMSGMNRSTGYSSHGGTGNDVAVYGMVMVMPGLPMGSTCIYQNGSYVGGSPDYGIQQILIPNDMVGCIIGKHGSKINEIRQVSGSHIKIMDPVYDTNERLVVITGSYESNQMAMFMLNSQLESEKSRMMV